MCVQACMQCWPLLGSAEVQHGDGTAVFSHDACSGIEGAKVMAGWGYHPFSP